jgi:hypothetical protein
VIDTSKSVVLDRELEEEKNQDSSGPRIRCPPCGWVAAFLGQPVSVAQRWAYDGMPVRKQGRYVETSRGELNRWLVENHPGSPFRSRLMELISVRN